MTEKEKALQENLSLSQEANELQFEKIKQLEDELFKWKVIGDTLPNCIYIKDLDGKYVWLNQGSIKQVSEVHGIHFDIIGKTDLEIFPREAAEDYQKNDNLVWKTRKGWKKRGKSCIAEWIRNGKSYFQRAPI